MNNELEVNRLLSIFATPKARRGCFTATPKSFLWKFSFHQRYFRRKSFATYTSIPRTDGQTFSLSEPNGRFRDIPNELINILTFLSWIKMKHQNKANCIYRDLIVVFVIVLRVNIEQGKHLLVVYLYRRSVQLTERQRKRKRMTRNILFEVVWLVILSAV